MSQLIVITGVSSGLGRAFALEAIRRGHRVVGTVRTERDAAEFSAFDPERAAARILDVSDAPEVSATMAAIEANVGPIDVLIANAGYGFEGLFEESTVDELRRQFEVNVFGAVETIRAVLPAMRSRRRGRIIGVTSIGGLTTSPGLSFYHGSKFALEGILESLGKEVAPLGIRVTALEPGPFRTDWSGRSMTHADRTIADYDVTYAPIRAAREAANGAQPGDPKRAAIAVLDLIESDDAPAHLLLGTGALQAVDAARAAFDADRAAFERVSRSTDYPS